MTTTDNFVLNLPIQTSATAIAKLAQLSVDYNIELEPDELHDILEILSPNVILVMTEPDLLSEVNELLLK